MLMVTGMITVTTLVSKRTTKEYVSLPLSGVGKLVRKDMENAEMYNVLCLLWFSVRRPAF